jgi:hypothetical protein
MTDTSKMPLFDSNGDWLCRWIETAHFDRAVWLNMATYFSATWVFGSPGWKCVVIALTVGLLSNQAVAGTSFGFLRFYCVPFVVGCERRGRPRQKILQLNQAGPLSFRRLQLAPDPVLCRLHRVRVDARGGSRIPSIRKSGPRRSWASEVLGLGGPGPRRSMADRA